MHNSDLEMAALYGADRLTEAEEAHFSQKMAADPQLIMHTIAQSPELPETITQPPQALRDSLFDRIFPPAKADPILQTLENRNAQAIVVADSAGIVEWVSPAFSRMCGYTLGELKGHKAGKMLQGERTEAAPVEKLRAGIRDGRRVEAQVVNYHKNGSAYEVRIWISPLHCSAGELVGFVAVENQV